MDHKSNVKAETIRLLKENMRLCGLRVSDGLLEKAQEVPKTYQRHYFLNEKASHRLRRKYLLYILYYLSEKQFYTEYTASQ